ncbi:hypothetical protein FQN54_001994 [Arachnomyces sp. PD_36]|nr:hypothetical protein FQN54_001994 [Arachnomyces sp. PD_36]
MASEPQLQTSERSSPVPTGSAPVNPPTSSSLPVGSDPVSSRHHRQPLQSPKSPGLNTNPNQRRHDASRFSSSLPNNIEHGGSGRSLRNSSGHADASTPEDSPTRLQQTISARASSTRADMKDEIEQEDTRSSFDGNSVSQDVESQPSDFDLPSRDVSDRLIDSYLKWENVNLPVFDVPNFYSKYEDFWGDTFDGDQDVFYATLNMIFALGCFTIGKPRLEEATAFYDQAQKTVNLGISYDDGIGHVQLYLLSSRYLYATGSLGWAWSIVSLAISQAQFLGLHLTSKSQNMGLRADRELMRKVWYCCMIMQRTIAMAKGLSTVGPPSALPLPVPLENEYIDLALSGGSSLLSERPSIIEYFNGIVKLYGKLEGILTYQDELRSMGTGFPSRKMKSIPLQSFLDFDNFLSEWKESLPPFLQPDNSHPALGNSILQRHTNILHIEYLHTCLLLRRPFLSLVITSDEGVFDCSTDRLSRNHIRYRYTEDTPLSIRIIRDSALRCVLLARKLLDVISQHRDAENVNQDVPEPLPSWWDNIRYIYACTTILISARTCPVITAEAEIEFLEESWKLGIKLLEGYVDYSDSAVKCISALRKLLRETGDENESDSESGSEVDNERKSQPRQVSNTQLSAWLESLPADLEEE